MVLYETNTLKELTQELLSELKKEVGKTVRRIDSCREGTGEALKGIMRTGMENMLKAVEVVLLGMSEGIDGEMRGKEKEEMNREKQIDKIEEREKETERKIKELEAKVTQIESRQNDADHMLETVGEAMVRGRKCCRLRESVWNMEGQVEDSLNKVKVVGLELDKVTEDRQEIIRMALDKMKKVIRKESSQRFEEVISRTRIVVLGKGTAKVRVGENWMVTVPILLCCQCAADKNMIVKTLRAAGHNPSFYWPDSMVEFVRGARQEIRRKGFEEEKYQVRIRPERRNGRLVIRGDVRTKDERHFRPEVYWKIPGDRKLLEDLGFDVYSQL
jgi:hypothetical protein